MMFGQSPVENSEYLLDYSDLIYNIKIIFLALKYQSSFYHF